MVVSALIAICLGQGTLFKQVVPNPTGKNGYEELVRAGELLRDGQFSYYLAVDVTGVQTEAASKEDASKTEARESTPPDVDAMYGALKDKTLLQRRRWAMNRYSPAIDMIYKAAQKPIFDPRTNLSLKTTFPELAALKDIAKLIPIASYVYLADGKGAQATQLMVTGLDIFERTSYSTLIHYLVGIACHSIILASVEQNLTYFSQADAMRLEEGSARLLERPTVAGQAIVNDGKFTSSALEDLFSDTGSFEGLFRDEDQEKAKTALQKLTESDKIRLISAVKQRYRDAVQSSAQKFTGPESEWVQDEDATVALKPDWSTDLGIADAITEALMPVYSQVGIAAAKSRTQVRILGLVASIIKFRWEHNQLPAKLEDAVGKERTQDPLSRLPFELRKDGTSGFSVVSKGTKETGEIALRYRRQTNSGSPGPP